MGGGEEQGFVPDMARGRAGGLCRGAAEITLLLHNAAVLVIRTRSSSVSMGAPLHCSILAAYAQRRCVYGGRACGQGRNSDSGGLIGEEDHG